MTVPVTVIVPFPGAIESHLSISLLSEYPCFLKPVMFVTLETDNTVTVMYSSARYDNKRSKQE